MRGSFHWGEATDKNLMILGFQIYNHVLIEKMMKFEPLGQKGIFVSYTKT